MIPSLSTFYKDPLHNLYREGEYLSYKDELVALIREANSWFFILRNYKTKLSKLSRLEELIRMGSPYINDPRLQDMGLIKYREWYYLQMDAEFAFIRHTIPISYRPTQVRWIPDPFIPHQPMSCLI